MDLDDVRVNNDVAESKTRIEVRDEANETDKLRNDESAAESKQNLLLCLVTVEPILFVIYFSQAFTGSVQVNLLETVACLQDLKLDISNCSQPLSDSVELLVQPKTAYINSCIFIVQAVIPSILSLFIGPWSDQNGRKPFLIISLTGFTLSYIAWGFLVYLPYVPIWYYITPAFIVAVTGGNVAAQTCSNCYISDISTPENRAKRLTVISSVSLIGSVSGFLLSAEVFSILPNHGYTVVFFTAAFVTFSCMLYTIFLVREIIRKQKVRDRELLNLKFIKEIFSCITVKEKGYSRAVTILLMYISFFMHFLIQGESSIKYLAVKKSLGWTLQDFNIFSAVTNVICVITCNIGIHIFKLVGFKDLWIALLAGLMWCLSDVLLSFTQSSLMFWVYSILGSFAALLGPTVTSEMANSVPKHHLGKLFALDATIDSLTPFTAPLVYATIYTSIYVINPLFIYLVSAGFAAAMSVITIVILILRPILVQEWRR